MTDAEIFAAVGAALVAAVDARAVAHADLGQAAAYASITRRGAKLTAKQARIGYRLLSRSVAGLARAGIELPLEPPEPAAAPVQAPVATTGVSPGREPTGRVRADGKIGVRAPYELRDVMKAIPGGVPGKNGGVWEWAYPGSPSSAAALVEALSPYGGRFSPKVVELAADHGRRNAIGSLLVDGSPLPEVDFGPLIKPGFTPWDHQIRAVAYATQTTASLLAMSMGPQPVDTPILTPKGWRVLGDLAAGDEVFDDTGAPVPVRAVRHYGDQPVYKITLSDGTSTRATAEHRWLMRSATQRYEGRLGQVVTTQQMLKKGLHNPASRNAAQFFLPDAPIVDVQVSDATEMTIPAYSLGVLLGDGAIGHNQVTVTCPDEGILQRLRSETTESLGTIWVDVTYDDRCPAIRARKGELRARLDAYGLTGRSETKVIPEVYLLADADTRWDLLRGLLDTDGHGTKNARVEFCSASETLATQVAWLARSLGAVVREAGPSRAGYKTAAGARVDCLPRHRVAMAFPLTGPLPFSTPRKIADYLRGTATMQRRNPPRSVRSIEPDGIAPVCCIELDTDATPLYLTGTALIPTHNSGKTMSTIAAVNKMALERPQRVVITCPNKVRGVWNREVRKFSAIPWHIVNGKRESRRAASGYVDLGLSERLTQAEECLFDCSCGAPVHAVVVNYECFANDPWNEWVPPRPIDTLVLDEIHRIKSYRLRTKKSRRTVSAALGQWVNFTHKRIGLTGTPLPQTPLDVYGIFRALDPGIFGGSWTAFKNHFSIPNPNLPEMIVGYKNVAELAEKFFSITYRPEIDLKLPKVTDVTYEFDLEPKARKIYDSLDKDLWADLSGFTGTEAAAADWDAMQSQLGDMLDEGADPDAIFEMLERIDATHQGKDVSTVTPANVMVRLLRLQQLTGGTVNDDDGEHVRVSTAKAESLAEALEHVGCTARTETHEPEPVIVFCRFRSDLDAVREVALVAGLRYAEVSGRRHDGLTADAEMNPGADVVGVQIQSGGTGVDFTRSRIRIWYSLGYWMSDYDQACKRQDRPGQTRPVLSIHLLARSTADIDVYTALDSRRAVVESVMRAHGVAHIQGPADPGAGGKSAGQVGGQGAVELPFAALIENERLRMGVPTAKG